MSDTPQDGGPAFPPTFGPNGEIGEGMSLREWFAGQNMAAMLGGIANDFFTDERHHNVGGRKMILDHVAKIAVEVADALLAARDSK